MVYAGGAPLCSRPEAPPFGLYCPYVVHAGGAPMWFRLKASLCGPGWRCSYIWSRLGRPYVVLARGAASGHRYCNQPEASPLGLKRHNRLEAASVHLGTISDATLPITMPEAYPLYQKRFHNAKCACIKQTAPLLGQN